MGIRSLKGKVARDIWTTETSKKLPRDLWKRTRFLLEIMNASSELSDLKIKGHPPDVRLHRLSGDRSRQWSVTIHKTSGWRIAFRFEKGEFVDVEIVDYH